MAKILKKKMKDKIFAQVQFNTQPISRVDSGYPKRSLISNGIVFKSYVTAFAIVTRAKCFAKIISVSEKNKSRKYNWPPVYIVNIFDICIYT